MMNVSEIQQRFSQIEYAINLAAEVCLSDYGVPQDVKNWVEKFNSETDHVNMILETQDKARIRQSVSDMEEIGDRVNAACQRAPLVTESVRMAVLQAHRELAELKQQLH